MYGKLVDGVIEYAPNEYIDYDGNVISNFNKSISLMEQHGFKPVVDIKPSYIFKTQYCELVGYKENHAYIEFEYVVREIEPTELEIENEEMELAIKLVIGTITDDEIALQLQKYYDEWQVGVEVSVGRYLQYEGVLYKVLTAHTTQEDWTPNNAPSLFAKLLVDPIGETIMEWQQPDSTNAYMIGDKVLFNGITYVSTIDNNIWQPDVYGWEITG